MKEQQLQEAKCRKEEQVRAQQRRKQQAAQFRKRTRTGQPVMKYRIDKVLEQLQSGKM
jgi:rRNA processing